MRHLAVALALGAMVACGHPGMQTPTRPHEAFEVQALVVGAGASTSDLAACLDGETLVPRSGGIAIAGTDRWLIAPGGVPITSVACDDRTDVFYLRGTTLVLHGPVGRAKQELPAGTFHLVGAADSNVWIYGELADRRGAILHYDPEHGLGVVYIGDRPVRALAAVDLATVAAVLDRELLVFRGDTTTSFGDLGPHVDGLAIDHDGAIFVSGPGGIVRLSDLSHSPVRIVAKIHGALRARGEWIDVLWPAAHAVLRIAVREQRSTTVEVPVPRRNIFVDGPASDRRESVDIDLSYVRLTQSAAMILLPYPVEISRATLAGPITFQGGDLAVNVGPLISRHAHAALHLLVLDGGGSVASVVATPNHSAMPLASTDFGEIATGLDLGVRIPFGWFSVSAGAGFQVGLMFGTVAKLDQGALISGGGGDVQLSAWVRGEAELGCKLGLYAQASSSKGLLDPPGTSGFSLGLALRVARTCY